MDVICRHSPSPPPRQSSSSGMEPNTEDSMQAKKSRLKPLLLVEQVRSRAECERGSSPESAHSIGPSSPSIEATLLHSGSIRGINNVMSLPVSPTLPTPPGTPKPFQLSPENEDLEQARPPVLLYHLPFRQIASNKAPVMGYDKSPRGIVSNASYVNNQSTLAEALQYVDPKMDTTIISGAGSDTGQNSDHRDGPTRHASAPQIMKMASHPVPQSNPSISFPLSFVQSRSRTESTFSYSSCSSDTSNAALSPSGSSRQSYPIRRSSSFSRSISCDSRGSYGTFGGPELGRLNQSRGDSLLDQESIEEISEEELDRVYNTDSTPKITQQAPIMQTYKFPTSHSSAIPSAFTSTTSSALPSPSKISDGVTLTATRPLALEPTLRDGGSRRNRAVSALSAYPFPVSVSPLQSQNVPESLDAPFIKETPTRMRVLSSPATLRPHEVPSGRRVPKLSLSSQTELRRVVLPQSPFVHRIDPTRLPLKTTPTSTPSRGSPIINTATPFAPVQVPVRRGSAPTVYSPRTAYSPNAAGNKPSKLRRVTSLLGRIFERRISRSNP